MSNPAVTLLDNASATGDSVVWPGGSGAFTAEGTFDGATVKLQMKTRNGSWLSVGTETELTSEGAGGFTLPAGEIRAEVSGGSSPTGLYAYATVIDRGRS